MSMIFVRRLQDWFSVPTEMGLVLVGCLALAGCAPAGTAPAGSPPPQGSVVAPPKVAPPVAPLPEVAPIQYGALGEIVVGRVLEEVVAEARPLRWSVAPSDPLALAIHLRRAVPPNGTRPSTWLGFDARPQKLTVSFRYPDAKVVTRTVVLDVDAGSGWFGRTPTVFLEFAANGVTPTAPSLMAVDYQEGPVPPWDGGTMGLKVEGDLIDSKASAFATGWVAFDVNADYPGVADLSAVADAKREALEVPLRSELPPEAGFVADTLIQLATNKWVARFAEGKIFAFELTSIELGQNGVVTSADTQSIRTCVASGSLVETPSGPKPVETLRTGDLVTGWDFEAGQRVATPIIAMSSYRSAVTYQLAPHARFSARHPIWMGKTSTWRVAASVEIQGDTRRGPAVVHQLTVGEPHNYFVGGLLTHNKDRAYDQSLDDPWFFMWDPK